MALRTALSRRRCKFPAINNSTAGLRLTQDQAEHFWTNSTSISIRTMYDYKPFLTVKNKTKEEFENVPVIFCQDVI